VRADRAAPSPADDVVTASVTVGGTPEPADLDVLGALSALDRRECSSVELVESCLARIGARNGAPSHDGDPASVNAWARVYPEQARAAARAADERRSPAAVEGDGPPPPLCGLPVGLQDLVGAAGFPLTASSRVPIPVPETDSTIWRRLRSAGAVLLGHLHTHEFGVGATTDQVGNPWDLARSAGGSAGGAAAALAASMVAAAAGPDTYGSLRIPAALCGVSAIKPTRGAVPLDGVLPVIPPVEDAGPMARTVADCALLHQVLTGMAAPRPLRALPLAGRTIGRSPRTALFSFDADVADAYESACGRCEELGATVVTVEPPAPLDILEDYLTVFGAEIVEAHRPYETYADLYRPALRGMLAENAGRPVPRDVLAAAARRRDEVVHGWMEWFGTHDVLALIEPTVAVVAPIRGGGYRRFGTELRLGWLTHYWNWTGFPVVSFPAGVGGRSELPVGVSLIGPGGCDLELLGAAITLQESIGLRSPAPL